jgi:hypothetical protein
MGEPDFYPFILSVAAVRKLHFVHKVVRTAAGGWGRGGSPTGAGGVASGEGSPTGGGGGRGRGSHRRHFGRRGRIGGGQPGSGTTGTSPGGARARTRRAKAPTRPMGKRIRSSLERLFELRLAHVRAALQARRCERPS